MIFKTFDSNIDKISSKWGMFGRSFNDIGTAIIGRIRDINKAFQATDNLVGSIKDSDSIWKRLYPSKESIKEQLVDVDALYPDKSNSQFSSMLSTLVGIDEQVKSGVGNWQDYFNGLSEGEKWQIEFVQNTDLQKASLSDVKKAYDSARASTLAHNEAIKAQTFSAKAGKVALQALAMAGNMLAMWAISKVISLAVSAWDHFNVTVKEVQENINNLTSNIESLNTELDELNSKSNLTDAEQKRLKYLETRIGLEERLLKIEQTRLEQEQLGKPSKITDWFDEDSYVKKASLEFGEDAVKRPMSALGVLFPGINNLINLIPLMNNISAYFNGAEAVIKKGNEQYEELEYLNNKYEHLVKERDAFEVGSHDWQVGDERVARIASELEAYQKQVTSGSYADLLEKYGQYTQEIETLEGILANSDYLSADEIAYSQKLLDLYSSSAASMKELINNIAISLGDQSLWVGTDLELLDSKTDRLTANTIQRFFTDEEIKVLAYLDFDRDASINTLRSLLKEEQEVADDEPINLSDVLFQESLDKFQSSVKSAADAYTTLLSGDYSSSELLDSIQAINLAATDMGGSINWESIGNIEELDKAIQSISNTYLDSFLNSNNINPDSDFARMLRNVADETYRVKAAYDAFNGSVDTIQNSYKTLNDAITEYNQNGHVTLDTLQSILEIDNRYISCLMDENGKLALNEEMYEKLTLAKLDDAKNTIIQEGIQELENIALENSAAASDKAGEAVSNHAQKYKSSIEKIQKHTRAVMDDSAAVAANNEVLNGGTVGDLDAAYQKALAVNEKAAKDTMAAIEAKLAFVDSVASNTASNFDNISNAASSSSASAVSDFSETIDFFERRVEVLDNALSHLDSTLDNITGSFGKNNLIDAQLSINEEKFNNYSDALAMYTQKANEAFSKLPADIAAKVKDGAVALTDFIGEGNKDVVEAIKEYESWTDKISDCKQELAELKTAIRQLELEKFNNIMDDFNNQFNLRDDSKDLISKQIDLLKEAGVLIGKSFYTTQIDQTKKQLELLETEKERLVNQMSSAISSGRVQKGTEEWLEMVNALNEVDGGILDCKKSIEEFDNAILDLRTEIFDRIQKQFSNLDSEISNILDLFDGFEVSDDKGAWSKEGLSQLGLLAQQYELAQYRVQQYNDEIDELNAQYLAGKYSATEYGDKLAELSSGQWDAVQASESAKDAIMDLNEARVDNAVKGIEKEIDAYKELIDAQLDALKASKDLHDYEKSIAEKTKSITDLERQIAAMQNDTSAATVAKRKNLEDQLAGARKDLEETEYQHSVEVQEDALNKQYEAYEKNRSEEIDKLRESLTDRETILAESFDTVKNNASTIGQQITTVTKEHGVNVSDTLVSSWQSGKNAVAGYGQTPSQNTSAFTGNIMGAETEINNQQKQADALSGLLAGTYSAKADSLAAELITSYNTGSNPPAVTDTLHDSPANTSQGGYAADKTATAAKAPGTLSDKKVPQAKVQHGITDGINTLYSSSNIADINKWLDQNKNIYSLGKVTTSASGAKNFKVSKYASGSRNAKGGLRIVDEEGSELTLAKLSSGNYTIGNAGDQILTKAETDNVFEWAKIDPKSMIHINMMNYLDSLRTSSMPNILPNNVNNNTNNNNPVQIGNLINVQGSINSSDVKQMESIANKAVDRLANKIHDRITYGS